MDDDKEMKDKKKRVFPTRAEETYVKIANDHKNYFLKGTMKLDNCIAFRLVMTTTDDNRNNKNMNISHVFC